RPPRRTGGCAPSARPSATAPAPRSARGRPRRRVPPHRSRPRPRTTPSAPGSRRRSPQPCSARRAPRRSSCRPGGAARRPSAGGPARPHVGGAPVRRARPARRPANARSSSCRPLAGPRRARASCPALLAHCTGAARRSIRRPGAAARRPWTGGRRGRTVGAARFGGAPVRGRQSPQVSMLALVDPESRVPAAYPIRAVRALADAALTELSPVFDAMYAETGRPSVPPERLLKASLLMALYSVRSERAFREQLDYKLLFRWFLGMDLAEPSFDPTVFTKNRQRLLRHRVAQEFFDVVVAQARRRNLMSEEHFSVDGTLIEAAASLKSFRPHDEEPPPGLPDDRGNPLVDFHGQKRSNATHASTTDPEARLMRKGNGNEAKLVFVAHALMENRNGLLADLQTTEADGYAERDVALEMLDQAADRGFRPKTLASEVNLTVDAAIKSAFRARRNTNWLDIARRSGGEAVRGVG